MTATRTALRVLSADEVLAALGELRTRQPVQYWAFYSSQLGGVVTDPALMLIPFDDHMVHRGHGIFDTAGLANGRIYDLDAHLDRFVRSAESSRLALPCSRDEMRSIVIRTTAASGRRDGSIRYWLSSGPGSLELSPAAGSVPGFFVMVFAGLSYPERWYTQGMRVMTTTYPIKPPLYAVTKATNYLPNVLMQMEAKAAGLDNGVFIDPAGNVGESSNMNVAFVTSDGVLRHPKFEHVLAGCTSQRLLELASALVSQGLIAGVEVCDVPVAQARQAREMFLLGSSVRVAPVVEWDGRPIGDGRPGPVARALLQLLDEDMHAGDRLIEVPDQFTIQNHKSESRREEGALRDARSRGGHMAHSRWRTEFGWGAEFGWKEKDAPGPQTEDSRERGFSSAGDADDLGHSDGLDLDGVGDIADEGPGRRG